MVTENTKVNQENEDGVTNPSGLGRARLAFAISAGKLAGASGRFFHIGGGTSLPGMIARRIDPNVLKSVVGASKAKKIVITGSNGKTTTARMTAAIADFSGQRVSHNRTGSNMLQGVTSVAVNFADMFGRLDSDVLLFEIDEGTIPLAVPEIQPDVVLITNIFRDQLDRYGELYSVANALNKMLESCQRPQLFSSMAMIRRSPASAKTRKPSASSLAWRQKRSARPFPNSRRISFAVSIARKICSTKLPTCRTLASIAVQTAAIHFPNWISPPHRFNWQQMVRDLQHVKLRTPQGEIELEIPLPGLHNVYNAAAAIGAAMAAGFRLEKCNCRYRQHPPGLWSPGENTGRRSDDLPGIREKPHLVQPDAAPDRPTSRPKNTCCWRCQQHHC